MLLEEAQWLGSALGDLSLAPGAVVLNVGSSTEEFRRTKQPFIDSEVFGPLEARGMKVVHVDAKPDVGVDVVVDVTAGEFVDQVPPSDVVLCTNLLEHVEDRDPVVDALRAVTAPGGRLIVTVPLTFPYHPDPIDTGYRPTPEQLTAELLSAGFEVERAETIDADCGFAMPPDGRLARLRWRLSRAYAWRVAKRVPPNDRSLVSAVILHRQQDGRA